MCEIAFIEKNYTSTYKIPENHNGLTQKKYVAIVRAMGSAQNIAEDLLKVFISPKNLEKTNAIQRYHIYNKLKHFLTFDFTAKRNIVEYIETKDLVLGGYSGDFSNVTWEEFIHADSYFLQGNAAAFCAVMYRQENKEHRDNIEADPRVSFTIHGANHRAKLLKEVDPAILDAVLINYKNLRDEYIVKFFPLLFKKGSAKQEDAKNSKKKSFSWLYLHRMFCRNNLGESANVLKLPCKEVLLAINENIRDANNREKRNKR